MKRDELASSVEQFAQDVLDWFGNWSELSGSWAGLLGGVGGQGSGACASEAFSAPTSADRRILRLQGPLRAGVDRHGQAPALSEDVIGFEPSSLAPSKTDFRLVVQAAAAHRAAAGVYVGRACTAVRGDAGDVVDADEPIPVWIVIP